MNIFDVVLIIASIFIVLMVTLNESPVTTKKRNNMMNSMPDDEFDDWMDALDASVMAEFIHHHDCAVKNNDHDDSD